MDPKALYRSFKENRDELTDYIREVKRKSPRDLFSVINPTLILNPYASRFPLHFFEKSRPKSGKYLRFFKATAQFYLKNFYKLFIYAATFLFYRLFAGRKALPTAPIAIDLFFLVNPILEKNSIEENYFPGLYDLLEKRGVDYTFLVRLYGIRHNPFMIIPLLKIFKHDGRAFIFEFDLLCASDLLRLTGYIIRYPFMTLRLIQQESGELDKLFNSELLDDIKNSSFESFVRYLVGRRVARRTKIEKIFSWHEFQAPDRSFALALKEADPTIDVTGCQLYLNYPTYLNSIVDDLDVELGTAPHRILVNGHQYLQHRDHIPYETGPSLRYRQLFEWDHQTPLERRDIVILGSHSPQETKLLLRSADALKRPIIYKSHPTLPAETMKAYLSANITLSDENIYELFTHTGIILTTASGTAVEAVACGVSVIILASSDNLTANPLADYGKGKLWEIVFSQDEVETVYNHLIKFRNMHPEEVRTIAQWYKEEFFTEPTEANIVTAFQLQKEKTE